jgi:hypothetical protein
MKIIDWPMLLVVSDTIRLSKIVDLKRMARRSAVAFASRSTFAAIKQELRNFVKDVLTDVVMLREEAYDPETTPVHNGAVLCDLTCEMKFYVFKIYIYFCYYVAFVVTESDILKCVAVGNPATHRQPMIIYRGTNASSTNGVGVHFSDDEISDEELSSTSDDEVDSDDIVLETADLAVSSTNDDELEDAEDNILSDELVSDSDRDDDQKDDTQVDLVRKALVRGVKRGYAEISEPLPDRAADIGWPLNPKNGFPEGCTRQTQKSYFEYESEENESYSDDPEDAWQDDVFDALCDRYVRIAPKDGCGRSSVTRTCLFVYVCLSPIRTTATAEISTWMLFTNMSYDITIRSWHHQEMSPICRLTRVYLIIGAMVSILP